MTETRARSTAQSNVRNTSRDGQEPVADAASALEKALRNAVETQPYTALGIALAVGWFFGRLHRPF